MFFTVKRLEKAKLRFFSKKKDFYAAVWKRSFIFARVKKQMCFF
jgi:hypothetical protein